jgi:hypothetical protein
MIDWDAVVLAPLNEVFGEPVQYTPAGQSMARISGIYDDAYKEVDPETGFATTAPLVTVRLAELGQLPKQGDWIDIERTAEKYVIRNVEPDGKGSLKLLLNERG